MYRIIIKCAQFLRHKVTAQSRQVENRYRTSVKLRLVLKVQIYQTPSPYITAVPTMSPNIGIRFKFIYKLFKPGHQAYSTTVSSS